jgi:hypothetical protein
MRTGGPAFHIRLGFRRHTVRHYFSPPIRGEDSDLGVHSGQRSAENKKMHHSVDLTVRRSTYK